MLRKKIDPSTLCAGGRKAKYTVSEAHEIKQEACLLKQEGYEVRSIAKHLGCSLDTLRSICKDTYKGRPD